MDMKLDVTSLKGIGPKRAEALHKLGIHTFADVLNYFPRRYADLTSPVPIAELEDGVHAVVRASVRGPVKTIRVRSSMFISKFIVSDGSSEMTVTLFNQQYKAAELREGEEYLFIGRAVRAGFFYEMPGPDIEPVSRMGILPVYSLSRNIPQNRIRNIIDVVLLAALPSLKETLPEDMIERWSLMPLRESYSQIHHPQSFELLEKARYRFAFEELLLFSLGVLTLKAGREKRCGIKLSERDISPFFEQLPFSFTSAQNRVVSECLSDMTSGNPMIRIVQGDVGSGKTAVAAALMYFTFLNGMQSCLMAPTEILAMQHYESFRGMLEPLGVKCALLTGSVPASRRRQIIASASDGGIDILIGTHALIQDDVIFARLALAVTDEQHRFGVEQRARLSEKGVRPHILVMSATPIPRTLSMIIYGDMDFSVIDQLPPGRKKVSTFLIDSSYHGRMYSYIRRRISEGAQVYIVCPLVEENENDSLKAVEEYAEELESEYLKDVNIRHLHGKMRPREKEEILRGFASGQIQVLVSTTVIEVGVNVPNASIMIIENAERFGLSQLHQLRGRVGRGAEKSYCFVVSDTKSKTSRERLEVFCSVSDGFEISRMDMQLRGPGDFFGFRQSGVPMFRHADLMRDTGILDSAQTEARRIIEDPMWYADPEMITLKDSVADLFNRVDFNIFS